ncbi:MAG TPA: hypothetical protein VNZ67_01985, partial [bacterium]|nr:hypothetical protein [bacterium]
PGLAGPSTLARLAQVLTAAQLPPSTINLKIAETLSQLGAPMDRASLQSAVQATLALLGSEAGAQGAGQGPGPLLDPGVQAALQDGLSQVQVAAQFSPSSQGTLNLQQAARAIQLALDHGSDAVQARTGAPAEQAAPLANPAGPALDGAQAQTRLSQALAAVVAEPSPQNLQSLQGLLAQLSATQAGPSAPHTAGPAGEALASAGAAAGQTKADSAQLGQAAARALASVGQTLAAAPAKAEDGPAAGSAARPEPGPASPSLPEPYTGQAALPSQREALVQFLSMLPSDGSADAAGGQAALRALSAALSDAGSVQAQRLVAAVLAQQPDANAGSALQSARQALQLAGDALAQIPAGAFAGESALKSALQAAGLPVPQTKLSGLGGDQVAEAVAWLQARDLPPQRPLVETVATWISQDRNALPAAGQALEQAAQLPASVLDGRPSLQAAVNGAQQAWQQAALSPEHPELATALRQWSQTQGLNLEAGLLAGASEGKGGPAAAPLLNGSAGLRPALVRLEGELRAAIRDNAAQTPGDAQRLGAALKETQTAVQALNAVPLQAQSPPAFDTVHFPLPVWMNGQIAGGQLSVTWRKGRERELDDKEAVNVAVVLNTEHLGTVKVLLQVWKGSASARVIGQDDEATAFLAKGAAELREGFAERTPFLLQNLEFAVADAQARPGLTAGADAPPQGGLNVSA